VSPTESAEYIWVGGSSGFWSDEANWQSGFAPPPGGSANVSLRFETASTGTNDLGSPFTLNRLTFDNEQLFNVQLRANLQFAGTAPELRVENLGRVQLTSAISLASTAPELTISGTGWGDLLLTAVNQAQGTSGRLIINAPAPTVDSHVIRLAQPIAMANGINLKAGNLHVSSPFSSPVLGQGALVVEGGTLQFGNPLTVPNAVQLKNDLVITQGGGTTMTGVISSPTAGTGLIVERIASGIPQGSAPSPNLTLTGVSTYDGPTVVRRGLALSGLGGPGITQLSLSGSGSLLNSSRYEVGAESAFTITGANASNNRLSDTAPMILNGGQLNFNGSNLSERIGATIVSGYAKMSVSGTGSQITAAALERSERGTLQFSGGLGSGGRLLIDAAPVLVGGGGSGAERSIVPFAIGTTSTQAGLVTYEPTTGLRLLTASEYLPGFNGSTGAHNVRLTSVEHNTEPAAVNALMVAAPAITGAGTIAITSGTVYTGKATIQNNLDFGAAEANLFNVGDLAVSGVISGNNGLTKSGDGTLRLTGANTFEGPLTINAGRIEFTSLSSLGAGTSPITLGGTTNISGWVAALQWAGAGSVHITRDLVVPGGYGGLGVNSADRSSQLIYNGIISGEGGLQIGRKITLAGQNTYSGGTQIFGEAIIASDAALGTGTVDLRGGTLTLQGPWETTRNLVVSTGGSIDTGGL
jgi:autotransporter-associated beta strand protein